MDLAGPSHKDPVPLTSDFDAGPGDDEENEKVLYLLPGCRVRLVSSNGTEIDFWRNSIFKSAA